VLAQYRAAKALEDGDFRLRLGLELGGAQVSPDHARTILAGAELDFVIGSIHNKSEALGGGDLYYVHYDTPALCHEMLADYFDSLLAVARLGLYDSLGHIIYPLRYMNLRDGQAVTLDPHWPVIREILTAVLDLDKSIELNTYCGRTVADWRETLALYRSMGGQRVTLGSDAHRPEHMGKGIRAGCQLLRELGFSYLTTYEKRQPAAHPLSV
jgi:histidinol-phosphatase (PHP family)